MLVLPPPMFLSMLPLTRPVKKKPPVGLLVAELPLKQAVALAAQISGAPRNRLYDAGLKLKRGGDE